MLITCPFDPFLLPHTSISTRYVSMLAYLSVTKGHTHRRDRDNKKRMGHNASTTVTIVNQNNPRENLELKGYRVNRLRSTFGFLAVFLTLGLLYIVLAWRKDFKMWMFYQECPLQHATKILAKDTYGQYWVEDVAEQRVGNQPMQPKIRYFINKQVKYVWDVNTRQFVQFNVYDLQMPCSTFHENPGGLSQYDISEKQQQYGTNFIRINVAAVYRLIIKEISNPFYLVQLYTVVVWMAQEYYDYSALVIAATMGAVGAAVNETRKQMIGLRKRVHVAGTVTVTRGGVEKRILSQNLVPGDIICISPLEDKIPFHCDAVLIEGTCSVDESMLTGESRPISKIPVPDNDEIFDYNVHNRHILYCGTQLLQGRTESNHNYIKAVVIRTGYMTSKGELIRAILFPKPIHFRFYTDLLQVAALFCCIGVAGMAYSIYVWIRNGGSTKDIILNSLDIITFVVPPLLPAALTATTAFVQRRLLNRKIYCLSAKHISLCGGVDVVCFDKTGTLTETDVDLAGVVPVQDSEFREPIVQLSTLPETNPLLLAVATCHSLIKVNEKIIGFPVDKKMFEAINWELKDGPPGVNPAYGIETPFLVSSECEVAILLRFPFESSIKRMTVVTQKKNSERYSVYMKGAPEVVSTICDPVTIPPNFETVLKHYTLQGYRVLALASRTLGTHTTWTDVQKTRREDLEMDSEFLGLLVLRNQLKKETLPSIRVLHEADIHTVMVTGDNLQTAVTVAKECEMIDSAKKVIQIEATFMPASVHAAQHLKVEFVDPLAAPEFLTGASKMKDVHNGNYCFAIDGPSFELLRLHDPALLSKCIHRGKVFARMAPEHKQHLIESLQRLGRQVAMVGDGCNDCAALRTADAGISLSIAEASMAAPFTSQETNISCVAPLIREGRTTLDAAFGTFQFAIGISFIFFVGVLMCYSISTEPSDFQYVIWDFGIVTVPLFTIGNISPPEYLHPRRPLRHLWAFLPMFSFFTFIIWQSLVLTAGWFYCHAQPWFEPYVFELHKRPPNPSYEETTLVILMYIGSVAAAFVFSPNPPYSRSAFSNHVFVVWSYIVTGLLLCVMFIPDEGWVYWLNFKIPPNSEYMVAILILGVAGGLVCYCWEKFLVRGLMYQWLWPKLNRIRSARHLYQTIEIELNRKPDWPKMGKRETIKRMRSDSMTAGSVPTSPTEFRKSFIDSGVHRAIKINRTPSYLRDSTKNTFKTFQGSRKKGSYFPNESSRQGESIAMSVHDPRSGDAFDLPPPPIEAFEAQDIGAVQMISMRSFEDDDAAVQEPAFNGSVNAASPFLGRHGTLKIQQVNERDVDPDVQLLSFRPVRRLSDYSPSQQKRHINGNGPNKGPN